MRPNQRRDKPPNDSSHFEPRAARPRDPSQRGSHSGGRPSNDHGDDHGDHYGGHHDGHYGGYHDDHHDGHHYGYHDGHGEHHSHFDVYVDLYGGFAYRYLDLYPYHTHHYYSYRYCNGYYGDPYYYASPYGHYGYSGLGLYFGFHDYYPYDPYYGYYGPPVAVEVDDGRAEGRDVGALDINVRPKATEIYLNGHYIGTAGNYDGYPQFLWLEEGEYELIFYRQGYETVRRIYDVRSGLQIDIGFEMTPGEAVSPDTLSHKNVPPESFEPPPDSQDAAYGSAAASEAYAGDGGARSRTGGPAATSPAGALPAAVDSAGVGSGSLDAREAPGRVRLRIEPAEASVYVDGRFVGTGEQVSGAYGAVLVAAGKHVIEVVHPAYETRSVRFEVEAGEAIDVEVPALERHGR